MSIITISREMGTGGIPIAHKAAEKLGYTLLDGETIEKAAKDFNIALLGKVPFEVEVGVQGDKGLPFVLKYPDSESAKAFKAAVKNIQELLEK